MSHAASLSWFARHELKLAWRDWAALMSGGHKFRDRAVLIGVLVVAVAMHGLAYAILSPHVANGTALDKATLVMLSGCLLLTFTMMLSQAMESVTRVFYSRDDLDLILSSPASSRHLLAVRIAMLALTTALMSILMVAPFINVAAMLGGAQWLFAYGAIFATSAFATGCAVLTTLGLFRTFGAKRTRLVAQIVAAIVGASLIIGIQVVAIISYGTMSRLSVMKSQFVIENAPSLDSIVWLPALAITGNLVALAFILTTATAFFAFATFKGAVQFRQIILATLGVAQDNTRQERTRRTFKPTTTHNVLMYKEWVLLRRDPWLMSQTLMQMLYLIPPALMLWVSYGDQTEVSAILAPVIVMAIGQLAGGLAWLTISGEDAPDLVATAPLGPRAIIWAKVKAVLVIVVAIVLPIVLAMAFVSVWGAFVTLIGALIAAQCAILIQLWFRAQANRTYFRSRQVASKASTFCEAFASILCAGTAALTAAGSWLALIPGVLTACVMLIAWLISPRTR